MITRRNFCAGLGLAIAAPYVVRNSGVLMPVKERLVRVPLNYIVALRDGPCLDGKIDNIRYPAGTILPYIGSKAPEGWRMANVPGPNIYAKKLATGWDIVPRRSSKLGEAIQGMYKFSMEQNVFVSKKDYI